VDFDKKVRFIFSRSPGLPWRKKQGIRRAQGRSGLMLNNQCLIFNGRYSRFDVQGLLIIAGTSG
jgi:hypothetical protein